jgi:hypothetical protein
VLQQVSLDGARLTHGILTLDLFHRALRLGKGAVMSLFKSLTVMSVGLAVGVLACDDDNDTVEPATSFIATLSGSNEVPAVTTTATGEATFTINGAQIEYTINVSGIENALVAHIHTGREGQNGPVRLNLCGTGAPQPPCTSGTGVLATGTNGTTVGDPPITFDELVEAIRNDSAYTNVHTTQNMGGEIRGQIVPE